MTSSSVDPERGSLGSLETVSLRFLTDEELLWLIELLIEVTALCVDDQNEAKKPLDPLGEMTVPPGVLASSMWGVRGASLIDAVEAAVADRARRCTTPLSEGVAETRGGVGRGPRVRFDLFLVGDGERECGSVGVGGVTNVEGVAGEGLSDSPALAGRGEMFFGRSKAAVSRLVQVPAFLKN